MGRTPGGLGPTPSGHHLERSWRVGPECGLYPTGPGQPGDVLGMEIV